MGFFDSIVGGVGDAFHSVSHVGHDLWDGGAKYLSKVPGLAMEGMEHVAEAEHVVEGGVKTAAKVSPLGMLLGGLQAGYHTIAGGYDAITGDRHGAVHHGSEAMLAAAGMIPGFGTVLHGAEAAGDVVLGGMNASRGDGGKMPTSGEAIGEGVNGLIDGGLDLFGLGDHTKEIGTDGKEIPKKTSTAQAVLGTLGCLPGLALGGIPGLLLGGGLGRSLGGLFGGSKE